jgi:hypothetical protein
VSPPSIDPPSAAEPEAGRLTAAICHMIAATAVGGLLLLARSASLWVETTSRTA